jgi:Kef-type K+ transport system membrane component KefB
MGTIALTCAAVDDATAWCLLALVVSIAQAKIGSALTTFVLTILYVLMMYFVARPLVAKLVPLLEKLDRITESGVAIIFVALLLSALSTELIGIHAIFGAFLLGAITPHNSRVAKELTERLEDLVRVMFLPAFFAFTGVRTQIGLLNTQDQWITCGLIIIVATIGKFGGTFMASKLVGLNWRDSAALGILMNTRGLVELIVLNLGLDLKIISLTLFTMLVIMALVTTFITSPMLSLFIRKEAWK